MALLVGARPTPPATAVPPQALRVQEHVEVPRVLVDARVVDSRGSPIEGLTSDDFRLLVDGVPARVESVEWVSGTEPYAEGLTPEQAASGGVQAAPPGRLIVFFFQADFVKERLSGLMRMKARAVRFLDTLPPEDKVAVLSFDSHLKLRLDFTNDRGRITRAIHESILTGEPAHILPGPPPSLAASFDRQAARAAASPEAGLLATANALKPLPGAKSLVFFGWGLGHLAPPWVVMDRAYVPARTALASARVAVFAIDVTDADNHDLEAGLEQVAADTGGFYAKTNLFPGQAMTRLQGAVAGHYLLVVVRPDVPHGAHTVRVELTRAKGAVLATSSFED
ncbi:MAG: VWA domain-containing protein [Thermoanaerobaculales bacterium]